MSDLTANWFLRAGWVFPVSGEPIPDGVVGLERPPQPLGTAEASPNRIAFVARASDVTLPEGAEMVCFPNSVVLPGFVNAHAHAELASLAGKTSRNLPFVGWLREVIACRAEAAKDEAASAQAIRDRLHELILGGCTTIGDFVSMLTPREDDGVAVVERAAHDVGLRAVLYSELIGFAPEVSRTALDRLRHELDSGACSNGTLRGAAPHAPYSASPYVYRESLAEVHRRGLPFSTHASEFEEEREFLASGTGPCADLLKWRDNWDPQWHPTGETPIEYLKSMGALEGVTSLAHCNLLVERELEILAASGTIPVHCPGTHAYFGRNSFRFDAFEQFDIPVALGTDSMASNTSFDMRAEARQFHQDNPGVEPSTVLRMLTVNGARALGLSKQTGSLESGKDADICVLQIDDVPGSSDAALEEALYGDASPRMVLGRSRIIRSAAR